MRYIERLTLRLIVLVPMARYIADRDESVAEQAHAARPPSARKIGAFVLAFVPRASAAAEAQAVGPPYALTVPYHHAVFRDHFKPGATLR